MSVTVFYHLKYVKLTFYVKVSSFPLIYRFVLQIYNVNSYHIISCKGMHFFVFNLVNHFRGDEQPLYSSSYSSTLRHLITVAS